jgi:hypothetical protein
MQWLVRIFALIAVSYGVPGAALAAGWEVGAAYRVGLGAGTVQAEMMGLQLVVLSVEMGEQEGRRVLWMRVGYRNMGQTVMTGKVKVPTEPVRLGVARTGKELTAVEVEERLVDPEWKAGLRPQTMRAGTLRFELGPEDDGRWLGEVMTLRMAPFLPISFRLEPARRFELFEWDKVVERVVGDFAMAPVLEPVAALPMRVEGIRVQDGRVRFAVVVKNGSRFPLQWSGKLSLREMRLLTEEAELLEPVAVSGVLAEGLGVVGQAWKAGEENRGEVSFVLPHAHAAATLSLLLPGYEPLGLTTDGETGQWLVVRRPAGRGGVGQPAPGVVALREEEERFGSVTAFWQEQGRRLQNRDQAGYLARFGEASGARAAQARSLAGMVRVPISWIEFAVPPMQKLEGDELGVPGVVVEMRCLLAGLPRENEFVSRWKCDLRRASVEAEWTVVSYEREGRPSFWDLGFSELVATDHFLVFYQLAAEDGKRRAETAGQQLEKARARLLRSRLPLERRYAAFVIPEKADFRAMTGRDPGAFSGATSAAYTERDGVLRVMNQAMYVNDSHFSSLQRRWGKQDRLVTMQHELVHLALAPVTRPWTPVWLVEGIATHYAGQLDRFSAETLRQRLPQGRVLAHLSQQPFMGANVGDVDEVWVQYHYSAAAVRWIEREFGEGKLHELYQAFANVKPKVWESTARTGFEEDMELESEAKKAIRLEMTIGEVERVLEGWHLDQVDAATRLSLQR